MFFFLSLSHFQHLPHAKAYLKVLVCSTNLQNWNRIDLSRKQKFNLKGKVLEDGECFDMCHSDCDLSIISLGIRDPVISDSNHKGKEVVSGL